MSKKTKEQSNALVVAGATTPTLSGDPAARTYDLHPALAGAGAIPEDLARGFKELSLPPIVKPREMPVGAFLHGRLTGIMDSPIKEYKNRILQLERPSDGFRFCFPMTAVIEKALGASEADQDAHIGEEILIQKIGVAAKGKKGKKPAGLFKVLVKPDAADRAKKAH